MQQKDDTENKDEILREISFHKADKITQIYPLIHAPLLTFFLAICEDFSTIFRIVGS